MAVERVWENEAKTVVRLDFIGHWSWAELKSAIVQVVKEANHPYDAILNYNTGPIIPRDILSIAQIAPDKLRYLILVSDNHPFLQTIGEIFAGLNKVFAQRYKLADSLDAAYSLTADAYPELAS